MSAHPDELVAAALRPDGATAHDNATTTTRPDDAAALAAFRRVVLTARELTEDDRRLHDPPPDLWSAIHVEVAGYGGGGMVGPDPTAPPAGPPAGGAVVDLASRRSRPAGSGSRPARSAGLIGAVAAAAILIAAVGGILMSRSPQERTEVVASADLSLLAGGGSGTAELVDRDGEMVLVVDVSDLQPVAGADFYELWMLAPDVSDMASMAKFTEDSGRIEVPVPDGVDPGALPVVDISEELDDGDDTHSGASILRGELT